MKIEIAPDMAAACHRAEADARGITARFDTLVRAREEDGLDTLDAELDAADALGLSNALFARLEAVAAPLGLHELERVIVGAAQAGMPTLRRDTPDARFTHDAAPIESLAANLAVLVDRLCADEELHVAVLPVGLGGTGGCSTGECLPEDAPAGPLFAPRAR